jgi:hypothetical protein
VADWIDQCLANCRSDRQECCALEDPDPPDAAAKSWLKEPQCSNAKKPDERADARGVQQSGRRQRNGEICLANGKAGYGRDCSHGKRRSHAAKPEDVSWLCIYQFIIRSLGLEPMWIEPDKS